jgi:hypothetical protein
MVLRFSSAGTGLLAAVGFLVDGRPGAALSFILGRATLFVAFLDVFGHTLLFVGIAGLISAWHETLHQLVFSEPREIVVVPIKKPQAWHRKPIALAPAAPGSCASRPSWRRQSLPKRRAPRPSSTVISWRSLQARGDIGPPLLKATTLALSGLSWRVTLALPNQRWQSSYRHQVVPLNVDRAAVVKKEAGMLAEFLEFDDLFNVDHHLFSGGICLELCKHSHLNAPASIALFV